MAQRGRKRERERERERERPTSAWYSNFSPVASSSFSSATAAASHLTTIPLLSLLCCSFFFFHFKLAQEEKKKPFFWCGTKEALLRVEIEEALWGVKGDEEDGSEAREADEMLLLSTGAIFSALQRELH